MKKLIVYDDEGVIFFNASDNYKVPVGLQHMEIDVPEGKRVLGVDVSVTPHKVILEDIPPSEIDVLRSDLDTAILELSMVIATGGN